ncbi:MAG: hypothetical protein O2971_02570 [Proteobacteria bacterium]|nr:hypothetical protein [Pseudomonadota bacterium]
MNWDAIGAIGEIVGALAVFLTLAYLAIQIRQNTRAVQAAANDSSVSNANAARQSMYENEQLAEIFLRASADPDSLDDVERLRFRLLVHNLLMSQSNNFAQSKITDLSLGPWEAQTEVIMRLLRSPGGQWFWKNYGMEFEAPF